MAAIPILFENEHLLVVDKPAGLLVVPAPGRRGPTVLQRLEAERGEPLRGLHRLDEDVSGTLAIARGDAARRALEPVFREHRADRVYLAWVSRMPNPLAGRIESRLQEQGGRVRSITGRGGERAVTHYRTLDRRQPGALVECRLETGRRNQIRVHMSDLGCPILGDRKYGDRREKGPKRVMLHAWRLAFEDRLVGRVDVVSAPPVDELVPPPGADDAPRAE